jgi:hypothetical protein
MKTPVVGFLFLLSVECDECRYGNLIIQLEGIQIKNRYNSSRMYLGIRG